MSIKCAIFDLDGVIVDTAKYHYLAWRELADKIGVRFSESDNERLKGVSRMKSLEILLEVGNMTDKFSEEEKIKMATEKNNCYVEYIKKLEPNEILKGATELLTILREIGIKTALGTASKNSNIILDKLKIRNLFDVIADGNCVTKAKPDPEVFLYAANKLGIDAKDCIVFEDAYAGIEAAHNGKMKAVGIGSADILTNASSVVKGLYEVDINIFK